MSAVRSLAVSSGAALVLVLVVSLRHQDVALLQSPALRSASFYSNLASQDSWMAGPDQLQAQRSMLKSQVKARTQSLADWNSGALAGKASYVTECANGDGAACDKLIADPGAIHALQSIDSSNPKGFAARHPQRSTRLQQQTPQMAQVRRVWGHAPEQQQAAHVQQHMPAWVRKYRTDSETKEEWKTPAWKDGALSDTLDEQWLKSCGQGNFYACSHIASDNDALHDLLHPHSKLLRPVRTAQAPLQPVYVAHTQSGGFLSSILNSLGLGDTYVGNDDKDAARPPKMVPDVGLDNRGRKAQYNDGTVGEFSDVQ